MYRHPLPSEGAMGKGYENRCGFLPVLYHFGLFFLESEDEIDACLFKTLIEESSRGICFGSNRYYFRREKRLSTWERYYTWRKDQ